MLDTFEFYRDDSRITIIAPSKYLPDPFLLPTTLCVSVQEPCNR